MATSKSPKSPSEPFLNPERIQVARMRRGLTKVELAQRLAVTLRTVTKYETSGAPARAAWITKMTRKGAGATTMLRAHGVLSGILTDAVKARGLAVNSAKGTEGLPRKSAKQHVYL